MNREVVVTGDGSKTIRLIDIEENYHSHHGALQEAEHVFIKNGLDDRPIKKEVKVFEMGFGSGLNACLSIIKSLSLEVKLDYIGVEAFPISDAEIEALNYGILFDEKYIDLYKKLHELTWNEKHFLAEGISFSKIQDKIEGIRMQSNYFDIIYYDAFGPRVQQDLWEIEILKKMYDAISTGGFLVTYCAKGQVKRNLREVGFEVEALPGPPGKREMTRAWKR
jgi:tRNA U34 5-methylaminomethyl-2-thiouridine-forming methyltransferase MnmC